tara:strand:+ start:1115 stop:1369 length:255 start_codon:yes stop_codon:yes gene_type:complete
VPTVLQIIHANPLELDTGEPTSDEMLVHRVPQRCGGTQVSTSRAVVSGLVADGTGHFKYAFVVVIMRILTVNFSHQFSLFLKNF